MEISAFCGWENLWCLRTVLQVEQIALVFIPVAKLLRRFLFWVWNRIAKVILWVTCLYPQSNVISVELIIILFCFRVPVHLLLKTTFNLTHKRSFWLVQLVYHTSDFLSCLIICTEKRFNDLYRTEMFSFCFRDKTLVIPDANFMKYRIF